jgi:hypothetical protein
VSKALCLLVSLAAQRLSVHEHILRREVFVFLSRTLSRRATSADPSPHFESILVSTGSVAGGLESCLNWQN